MGCVAAGDDAAGRTSLEFASIELIADADIENAGNHSVDPILRVTMRHQLYAMRHSDPDRIRAGL